MFAQFGSADWASNWIKGQQAQSDREYQVQFTEWEKARTTWVEANIQSRNNAADPEHYVPNPFPPIPKRRVWVPRPDGQWPPTETWVQDPQLTNPVLPPHVRAHTGGGFGQPNTAAETTDRMLYALEGLVQLSLSNAMALEAIKAKLGIDQ